MKRLDDCINHFVFFSATWPEDVRRIAARYMRNPIQIYVGTLDLAVCILYIYIFYYVHQFIFS
jgi:ATP-dependent RNA helicase DDX43